MLPSQPVRHISIHPPREGRDLSAITVPTSLAHFNPPSPRGEGQADSCYPLSFLRFQSTLPARGGTKGVNDDPGGALISIHPPRKGRDEIALKFSKVVKNFNPPSP